MVMARMVVRMVGTPQIAAQLLDLVYNAQVHGFVFTLNVSASNVTHCHLVVFEHC
jgi:hypothetical protein